jgi:hypothetical protein
MSNEDKREEAVGLLDVEERNVEQIELSGEGGTVDYAPGTFRKIGMGMATLVALVMATYVVPALSFARPWTSDDPVLFWNVVGREILGEGEVAKEEEEHLERVEAVALAAENVEQETETPIEDREVMAKPTGGGLPAYKPHADDEIEVPHELELPDAKALDTFYARLAETDAGFAGSVTRVTHWGDSVIAADNVTSTLRQTMQRRFGDAGHGFHLAARPHSSYWHRAMKFSGGEGWSKCYIIHGCAKDGRYGLGGTVSTSAGGGRSSFATHPKTPNGRKVSRYEIWYQARPGGGKLRLVVDGGEPEVLDTSAEEVVDKWHVKEVEDGPHELEIRASGGGKVKVYGVVMEREGPGVVWDEMSQIGAFTSRFLYFDPTHIREQIEHRGTNLIVFEFGGNDLLLKGRNIAKYREQFGKVLARFRAGDKPPACLVISPVDHGQRDGNRIVSVEGMQRTTDAQREAAHENGCAFFDTRAAMGGENSVARWRSKRWISGDLSHLTGSGQRVLGQLVYLALMKGYREYRARTAK